MRALRKTESGPGLDMVEVPIPEPGPGEVLIQVKAASICGTDLHVQRWDDWAAEHVTVPVTVGHEVCGVVIDHGPGVEHPALGRTVSVESHIVCGACSWCRTGRGHLCPDTQIIGLHRDGAFAEYLVVPAQNAWVDPDDMPYSIGALQENFGNAVHTATVTPVAGRSVLITGVGPVGLMCLLVTRELGAASVVVTDISDFRLELASKLGADAAIDATGDHVVAAVREATDGLGAEVLLEMSGAPVAIDQGFGSLQPGGVAVLLGLTSQAISFDIDDHIIFKGATVHGVVGRRLWDTWYQMRALQTSGGIDLAPIVTHRYALDDHDAAFATMASGRCGKVVLYPDPADADGPLGGKDASP